MSGPLSKDAVQTADDRLEGRVRPRSAWYLGSLGDHATHCGELGEDGLVVARCGVIFTPRPTLWVVGPVPGELVAGPLALRGSPPDPDQICPQCQRGGGGR